jgi:hypothetical protein
MKNYFHATDHLNTRISGHLRPTDAELALVRAPMPTYLQAPMPEYLPALHESGEPAYVRALREGGHLDRDLALIQAADHLRPTDQDFEFARILQAGIPEAAA